MTENEYKTSSTDQDCKLIGREAVKSKYYLIIIITLSHKCSYAR